MTYDKYSIISIICSDLWMSPSVHTLATASHLPDSFGRLVLQAIVLTN